MINYVRYCTIQQNQLILYDSTKTSSDVNKTILLLSSQSHSHLNLLFFIVSTRNTHSLINTMIVDKWKFALLLEVDLFFLGNKSDRHRIPSIEFSGVGGERSEMGWDGEKEIKHALKELVASKSVSNSRVKAVADTALKYSREYKRIVYSIEQVIWKSKPKHRLGGLCSMDAVLRQSRLKNGSKDVYAKRFLQHLKETIRAISEIPENQQDQVKRVVQEWQKQGFYTKDDIEEAGGQDHGYVDDNAEVGFLICRDEPDAN